MLGLSHRGFQSRLDVLETTRVERLFLNPVLNCSTTSALRKECESEVLTGVGESVEMRSDEVVRERRHLLDSRNGDVHQSTLLSLSKQRVVDLSRAELFRCRDRSALIEGIDHDRRTM